MLAGCGGGGSSSTTVQGVTTGARPARESPPPTSEQPGANRGGSPHRIGQTASGRAPGLAPSDPRSLPNQGSKAVAPGVPTTKGGDNSIQSYGVEADGGDRVQAATTAEAYLEAQTDGRWAKACTYLTDKVRTNLEALLSKATRGAKTSCGVAMAAFLKGMPETSRRASAEISVLSFRIKGGSAFLIFKDGRGKPTEMVMHREGGSWKIGALIGNGLPS